MTPRKLPKGTPKSRRATLLTAFGTAFCLVAGGTWADPDRDGASTGVLVSRSWLADQTTVQLVDARPADAARARPITGALRIDVPPATAVAGVPAVQASLARRGVDGSETVVLVGEATDLEAIAWRYWLLRWAGVARVHVLAEPLDGNVDGLGRGSDPPIRARADRKFSAPALDHLAVDATEVDTLYGVPDQEILDLRDGIDWSAEAHGYRAPRRFADGHVPHALPYAPDALLPTADGWPETARARHVLSRFGPRPINQVSLGARFVLVGEDGADARSTLTFLALERIGVEATVLRGGWRAWTADPARPIVEILTPEAMAARLERENPGLAADRTPTQLALFDNRGEGAYRSGHLPGAVHLESSIFEARFETLLATHWPDIDRDTTPIAFYCYGRDCVRSRFAATDAARAGFRRLLWVRSGFPGWRQADLRFFGSSAEPEADPSQ